MFASEVEEDYQNGAPFRCTPPVYAPSQARVTIAFLNGRFLALPTNIGHEAAN